MLDVLEIGGDLASVDSAFFGQDCRSVAPASLETAIEDRLQLVKFALCLEHVELQRRDFARVLKFTLPIRIIAI